ncbi:MAG: ADP-ribosylation factor-like protein [Candidatus Heimdallarchaeaceae archaeon]
MSYKEYLSFSKRGVPLTILGLPQAGKTTFVNRLLTGEFSEPQPTMGINFEIARLEDVRFDIFDMGGHEFYRKTLWENYIRLSYGFIFIVDSSNHDVIQEAKEEFWKSVNLKKKDEEFLVLFLCNKSDLETSMDLETMVKELDLYKLAEIPNASYQFFKVSMKTGENFHHAMSWLKNKTNKLVERKEIVPLMFLIAEKTGIPIISIDKVEVKRDPTLIAGFLSAVKNFASEIFGEEGTLQFIMSDEYKYIISGTKNNIYAILVSINDSQEEARRVIEIIENYIEETQDYDNLVNFVEKTLNLNIEEYQVSREYKPSKIF